MQSSHLGKREYIAAFQRNALGKPTSEFLAVDGPATGAVVPGEITALKHELRDHTVETGACIAEAVLASGELPEVSCSYGDLIVKQLENDSAQGVAVDGDVELQETNRKDKSDKTLLRSRSCRTGTEHVRRRWPWLLGCTFDNRDQEMVDGLFVRSRGI